MHLILSELMIDDDISMMMSVIDTTRRSENCKKKSLG